VLGHRPPEMLVARLRSDLSSPRSRREDGREPRIQGFVRLAGGYRRELFRLRRRLGLVRESSFVVAHEVAPLGVRGDVLGGSKSQSSLLLARASFFRTSSSVISLAPSPADRAPLPRRTTPESISADDRSRRRADACALDPRRIGCPESQEAEATARRGANNPDSRPRRPSSHRRRRSTACRRSPPRC
jgi:hypothetical protein